jgi:hypothetical protein
MPLNTINYTNDRIVLVLIKHFLGHIPQCYFDG